MKRMRTLGLSVFLIFSIASCYHWNWKPNPYVASYESQAFVNAENYKVNFSSQEIEGFICFQPKDIEALKVEIERVQRECKGD